MASKHVEALPSGLSQFIEKQPNPSPSQEAVWRYVIKQGRPFYLENTPEAYEKTIDLLGITEWEIPRISDYDRILNDHGFGAVPVSGFIPSLAFMGFQYKGVQPISMDVRIPENILYTPSPDMIHEGYGHVSMLSDSRFRDLLKKFGKLGTKVQYSQEDIDMYEATRELSILKEDPKSSKHEIERVQEKLNIATEISESDPSDAARLGKLYWYTVEYGLIKPQNDYKIWGAGLISSLGEGKQCLTNKVEKVPLSLDTSRERYDITEYQPKLFYVHRLEDVFETLFEFENSLGKEAHNDFNSLRKSEHKARSYEPVTSREKNLERCYLQARSGIHDKRKLEGNFQNLWDNLRSYPDDILAKLETLEALQKHDLFYNYQQIIKQHLLDQRDRYKKNSEDKIRGLATVIDDGLKLLAA